MKWAKLNGILYVLNLAVLAAVAYYFYTNHHSPPAVLNNEAVSAEPASAAMEVKAPPEVMVVTNELVVTNQMRWRQLESEDYKTYIARLRSIGCPEQTIRDIIIADLDKVLAPRVQSIYGRRNDLQYWHPEEEELANDFDHRERTKQERAIDREKRAVIQELLGVDLVRERLQQKGQEDYYERRLSFLPEDKRSQVRNLLENYDEQEQTIREKEWEDGEALNAADQGELRRLRAERQAAIAGALSTAEREQFDLWLSPTASAVRHALYGMDATEQEFLALYKLRKGFDDAWGQQDVEWMNDARRERWEQARRDLDAQIRQQLGEQRYADYKRGEDDDFHHLSATVSRYKLPRQRAAEVYELKRTAQAMRETFRSDPNLTAEQKDAALKAIGDETEKAVKQLLGDKPYNFYLRRGQGSWIRN